MQVVVNLKIIQIREFHQKQNLKERVNLEIFFNYYFLF